MKQYRYDLIDCYEKTWDNFEDFTQTLTKDLVYDLQTISPDQVKIHFQYPAESTLLVVNGKWFMDSIHDFANNHNIPLQNITFRGTNPKLVETYNFWHRQFRYTEDKINLELECFGLRLYNKGMYKNHIGDKVFHPTAPFEQIRDKKMNCFNANILPHRVMFVQELFDQGCLDVNNNIISVHHFFKDKQFTPELEKLLPIQYDLHGDWESVYSKIFEKDTSLTDYNKTGNYSNIYDKTYFTVTTESATCYSMADYSSSMELNDYLRPWYRELFITEKTFRPMLYWQPQLIQSSSGILRWLQECGFKTFSDYWNEDYDNEPDGKIRTQMIVTEVRKLLNKSKEELHEMYWDMMPILEYNRNLLLTNDFTRPPWYTSLRS